MLRIKFILFSALTGCVFNVVNAQVGIGTETAVASAKLELSSSERGFLMPRMTQSQRASITTPATGLWVFQIDNSSGFYYYTGTNWAGPLTSSEVAGLVKTDGQSIFSGDLNMSTQKISNLSDPTAANDLASKNYADGLSGGLLWKESVINLVATAPASPNNGDRYILSANWGGGTTNQIATYNSGSWSFVTPSSKDAVFASVPSNGYVYNGTKWSEFSSGTVYTFTGGLNNANNSISLANNGVLNNHFANSSVTEVKFNSMSASKNQLLSFDGSKWAPSTPTFGTVTSITGGSGISVVNGTTTPTVSISQLTLTMGGTNSTTGSITGSSALTMMAGGSNNSITLTPSGSGYSIVNGKVGMGISVPATQLHIQNSNTFSGNPGSNNVPAVQLFNTSNGSSSAHSILEIRTAGNSSGNPYLSIDIAGVKGFSAGLLNSTDQLIFNNRWDFNNTSNAYKVIQFNTSGQSRVLISDASGNIKTSWPGGWGGGLCTWDISVLGIYYTSLTSSSDIRLKNTIKPLETDFSSKYMKLNPVTYYWNNDVFPVHQLQYGFISQEVEEIFPDLIATASDSIQTKSMNYQSLASMHVEMLKKHQAELDELVQQYKKQEEEILALKKLILTSIKQ